MEAPFISRRGSEAGPERYANPAWVHEAFWKMNGDVLASMHADVARVVCDKRLQRYLFAGNNIDYGIVLSGEVELELDDGAVTTARSGDIIIQHVTMHLRRNPSATETYRIVFVLIEANPVVASGAPLEEFKP